MDIIVPNNKASVILDATMLSTLMSCGRLYNNRFNHDLQSVSGKSPSLEMGSIVHTYLEFYYKAIINGMRKDDAHGHGIAAATAYLSSEEVKNCEQADRELAMATCELYREHYRNDSWTPLEVEVVKGKQVYEDDDIRIFWKAKFDLLVDTNQGIFSVDHKTMKQRRDTLNLNNQFTGQCILTNARIMFVNKIGFQKTLPLPQRFLRVPINYSANRLVEWRSQILPHWAKILLAYQETGYWPPNYTHCENKYGFCQFKEVCEADTNMREELINQGFIKGDKWSI